MTYLILGHSTPYSLLRLLLVVRLSDPICGSALTGLSLEDGVGTWRMHIGTARDTFCNGSPISIFPSPADRMLCPKNQKCEFLLSCLDKTKSGKKDTQQSKLIYPYTLNRIMFQYRCHAVVILIHTEEKSYWLQVVTDRTMLMRE